SNFYNGSSSNILLNSTGTAGSASGRVGYSFTFSFGTMSPVVTTDSRTVLDMYDQSGVGFLNVSGFGTDPGQTGWATTIFVNGVPYDPASAIGYSYAIGVAQWQFMGGFGFSNGVGYTVTIVQ